MASTSKRSDNHLNYNWSGYDGPDMAVATKSINDLIHDDLIVLFPEDHERLSLVKVQERYSMFLYRFDREMRSAASSDEAEELANMMKEDKTSLQNFVTSLFKLEYESCLFGIAFGATPDRARDLCSKCPYYLSKHTHVYAFDEDLNICEDIHLDLRLKVSKLLFLNILDVVHQILDLRDGKLSELWRARQLLMDMCAPAHIFECMNPTGEAVLRQEIKTLEILSNTHVPMDDATKEMIGDVYKSVIDDIKTGKLPYIKDMHKAYLVLQKAKAEQYCDRDYYVSMKSTPQKFDKGPKWSILNSVYEHDTLGECSATIAFDEMVGYHSHYLPCAVSPTPSIAIKTILIRNGGKFKMRAIHIAENAIQDRCNWIHHKLVNALQCLASDCSKDQMKGRLFLKRKTLIWDLSPEEEKEGIYCFDFSNATDTMSQQFQYAVLRDLFSPIVADYWKLLSETEKIFFSTVLNEGLPYSQSEGQPQGLLGSFDAFSLAHHIMMLMVMKMCGLERKAAKDCYAVLGDDSVLTTVDPEIYHLDNPIDECYKLVCEYANFIVNVDKSKLIHYYSNVAEADFAKVTYINGSMCSPTPFRLALRYSSKNYADHIAVALWKMTMESPDYEIFAQQSLSVSTQGAWLLNVLKAGLIQSFDMMKTGEQFNPGFLGRASYCVALSSLDASVVTLLSADKDLTQLHKEQCGLDFVLSLDSTGIDSAPEGHKIWNVIEEEESKIQIWKSLYGANADDKALALLVGAMDRNIAVNYDRLEDEFNQFQSILKIITLAKANPDYDVSQVFPEASDLLTHFCKEVSNLLILRGSTKKPRKVASILQNAFTLYQELDILLGELRVS